MSHRVNILLSDSTWSALQQIPKGERSRFVEQAVADNLLRKRRLEAAKRIDKTRKKMRPVAGSAEKWIREDRDRHL